jgi:hypothetical protein
VQIDAAQVLTVTGIDVDSGIVVFEAEQMHNVLDDCGYEAFYSYGPPDRLASNGVSMVAAAAYESPISLDREVALRSGAFEVWLLTRTVSSRLANGRANFLVEADGRTIADVSVRPRKALPFWDNDPHAEWLPAGRLEGGGKRRLRVTFYRKKTQFDALGDLDAVAFVPVAR